MDYWMRVNNESIYSFNDCCYAVGVAHQQIISDCHIHRFQQYSKLSLSLFVSIDTRLCLYTKFPFDLIGAGKTRAHCGGNIADMIMFPNCWLVLPRTQHLWRTQKMFLKIFKNISCVRAARNNVAALILQRTGNIAGHNVAATMSPRFAGD